MNGFGQNNRRTRSKTVPPGILFAFVLLAVTGTSGLFALPLGHMGLGNHRSNGYIGASVGVSPVEPVPGAWVGLRAGWEFEQAVAVGLTGNWLLTELDDGTGDSADFGYGGVEIRVFLLPRNPVSLAFDATVGTGSVGTGLHLMSAGHHDPDQDFDGFLVFEPEVQLILRANRFVRIELGAGYLFTVGADLLGLTDGDLSGPKAILAMSLGNWR